jgi:uncharacterized protein YecT (DUF1311 family)
MTMYRLAGAWWRALLAATLLASAFTLPAVADDAETISACLKAERSAERDGHACIGKLSKPCMAAPGGETTAGMIQCSDREIKAWDALLNAEYKQLIEKLEPKSVERIRAAQRAWIKMRDGDCGLSYETFEGGTIAGVIAAGCMLDRTATRALQLHDLRTSNIYE